MAGKKSTRIEQIKRTTEMVGLLLDGLEPYEIRQYTAEEWGISRHQTDRYIAWANTRIQRAAERDDRNMLYTIKRRLVRQYRRAVQGKKGELARLLIKDLRDLYGFDKPKKVAHELDIIDKREITNEERADKILGLLEPRATNGNRQSSGNGEVATGTK